MGVGRTATVEHGTPKAAIDTSGRLTARRTISITSPVGDTVSEVEVLRLVAEGLSDAQIAERLFLSPYTVKAHLHSSTPSSASPLAAPPPASPWSSSSPDRIAGFGHKAVCRDRAHFCRPAQGNSG